MAVKIKLRHNYLRPFTIKSVLVLRSLFFLDRMNSSARRKGMALVVKTGCIRTLQQTTPPRLRTVKIFSDWARMNTP
jgi:hypothetical protein